MQERYRSEVCDIRRGRASADNAEIRLTNVSGRVERVDTGAQVDGGTSCRIANGADHAAF